MRMRSAGKCVEELLLDLYKHVSVALRGEELLVADETHRVGKVLELMELKR